MLNVYVCLNSQHSRWRIQKVYGERFPQLTEHIPLFYGNYFNVDKTKGSATTGYHDVNITDMFDKTKPELVVLRVRTVFLFTDLV